ncbi:MAG: hypothetical protein ACYDAR_12265 [Thermomicrobiales bacterium]
MRMQQRILPMTLLMFAVLLCLGTSRAAAYPPPQVTITAKEFSLDLPDKIEAGLVAMRYENNGTQNHNVLFIRLDAGKTLRDFQAATGPDDVPGVPAGGTTTVFPGQRRLFVNDFAVGNYVAFSTSTGPNGVPDVTRGMYRALTVVPSTQATRADEPVANLTVTITDAAPIPIPAIITAGPQTWKVTVGGTTTHEMTIARLPPGTKAADVEAWLRGGRKGPAPGGPGGGPVAGMQLLLPGQSGWLLFDLEPGDYTFNDLPGGGPKTALFGQFTVVARTTLPATGGGVRSRNSTGGLLLLAGIGLVSAGCLLRTRKRHPG